MHAAQLNNSPRLQRILSTLSDGRWYTTRDLIELAKVCAINSAVAELRENGFLVECCKETKDRFTYRLLNCDEAKRRLAVLGVSRERQVMRQDNLSLF